jgi:Flp pilus assembly protein TadG
MITAFVVIFVVAVLFVVGLVIDGGYLLADKRRAINEAESAARAGAQSLSIDSVRAGDPELDPAGAVARANAYLAARGLEGDATADADSVTVTVRITRSPIVLGIGGFGDQTLEGTGTANPVQDGAAP